MGVGVGDHMARDAGPITLHIKSSLRRGSARHGKLLTLRLNTTVPPERRRTSIHHARPGSEGVEGRDWVVVVPGCCFLGFFGDKAFEDMDLLVGTAD